MLAALLKYYLSLHYWHRAPLESIERMQLEKFKNLFAHAGRHSKFYRQYYGDHGVLDMKIESLADTSRIPPVNKGILRNYSIRDIMTCQMDERTNIHSTSGSSGEPFQIAFDKFADYSAHARVFWAFKKAGYRATDSIVMITRYKLGDQFEVEKDIPVVGMLQNKLKLFRREIISIYEPVDEIIAKLSKSKARVLWSTPSIMQIVCSRLKEKSIRLDFPIVFFTSEFISPSQKKLFISFLGRQLVSLYGAIESPSLGFDFGLVDRYDIFPNSNYFEFDRVKDDNSRKALGRVIITNLLNKAMPVIRYDLNDLAEIENEPGFGRTYIKRIVGRQDDILELANGSYLAHHHAHEMFMDFHECEMFRFLQKADKTVLLQLKIADDQDRSHVEKMAYGRWRRRFAGVPLVIEFVNGFSVNPRTGKFKNIEKMH